MIRTGADRLLRDAIKAAVASTIDGTAELVQMLLEMGWTELVATDLNAEKQLFLELGRAGSWSHAADLSALSEVPLDLDSGREVHVLYPADGYEACMRAEPGQVGRFDGVSLAPLPEDATLVLPVATERGVDAALAHVVELESVDTGWSPEHQIARASGVAHLTTQLPLTSATVWSAAEAAARRSVAQELIGNCEAMLELASRQARDRHQFGRPLGSFQVLRHRLAEAYTWITAAQGIVDAAWRTRKGPRGQRLAAAAKAYAGHTHAEVAASAMQICGAMGLTWEFPLHRLVRRGLALDLILGSAGSLSMDLGRSLLDRGQEPGALLTDVLDVLTRDSSA